MSIFMSFLFWLLHPKCLQTHFLHSWAVSSPSRNVMGTRRRATYRNHGWGYTTTFSTNKSHVRTILGFALTVKGSSFVFSQKKNKWCHIKTEQRKREQTHQRQLMNTLLKHFPQHPYFLQLLGETDLHGNIHFVS